MAKYHINSNGEVKTCHAVKRACPFGEHFSDLKEAYKNADKMNEEMFYVQEKNKTFPNSKFSRVRAASIKKGAKYNKNFDYDTPEVAKAAIEQGYNLEHFALDYVCLKNNKEKTGLDAEDLKVRDFARQKIEQMAKSASADELKTLIGNAKYPDSPFWDNPRTELCKKTYAPPKEVAAEILSRDLTEPDSGATISFEWDRDNPGKGIMKAPQSGFCFSTRPDLSKKIESEDPKEIVQEIQSFFDKNADVLGQENNYLGLWRNPDDNALYFDVSEVHKDAGFARKACQENDQIAYFDLQTFNSVVVDKNAKSGQSD